MTSHFICSLEKIEHMFLQVSNCKSLLNSFGKLSTNRVHVCLLNAEHVPTKELSCITAVHLLHQSSITEMCSKLSWGTDCH